MYVSDHKHYYGSLITMKHYKLDSTSGGGTIFKLGGLMIIHGEVRSEPKFRNFSFITVHFPTYILNQAWQYYSLNMAYLGRFCAEKDNSILF